MCEGGEKQTFYGFLVLHRDIFDLINCLINLFIFKRDEINMKCLMCYVLAGS